jgi:serine/threonine-protein kinase
VASAGAVGPTPQPSSSVSAPASKAPEGTRLTSPGGLVYALCGQGKATLTWWEPADGYAVQKVDPGPALTAEIVFRGASARYRMTVTCVAGIPTPVALPL